MATNQSTYLNALRRTNQGAPPIWMMRQAGRYLPEYRAIRTKHAFLEMVFTPEVAAEVTLQPIKRFGFDAAILFSDILVAAQALNAKLHFLEKKGPVFEHAIRTETDLNLLTDLKAPSLLAPIFETIRLVKRTDPRTPLIGFAGAPFTVAAYMVEGHSSPDLKVMKQVMHQTPQVIHHLLDRLTEVTIVYLNGQLEAGVDSLQLFDTWAMHLDWDDFTTFSLPYIQRIVSAIRHKSTIPITLFCKGSSVFFPLLATLQPDCLGLDWNSDIQDVRARVGNSIALQGNLDPYALYASPEILHQKVHALLHRMAQDPAFIFNLGHGLMPDMDPDQVKRVVDWVHGFNQRTDSSL